MIEFICFVAIANNEDEYDNIISQASLPCTSSSNIPSEESNIPVTLPVQSITRSRRKFSTALKFIYILAFYSNV